MDAQKKNGSGDILGPGNRFINKIMMRYAGKIATIECVYDDDYHLENLPCRWEDWMFDPDYRPEYEPLSVVDAIIAMVKGGETLYSIDGDFSYHWDGCGVMGTSKRLGHIDKYVSRFSHLKVRRPLPAKRTRPMTRWEILAWVNSEEARDWLARTEIGDVWYSPQALNYDLDEYEYQRARLLPDHSGIDEDTIQGFEVEE
jgi:hypothetical protein